MFSKNFKERSIFLSDLLNDISDIERTLCIKMEEIDIVECSFYYSDE